jgi:hypothetical protein
MRCVCHEHVINGALKNFPENLTGISLKPFRTILISPGRAVAWTLQDIAWAASNNSCRSLFL